MGAADEAPSQPSDGELVPGSIIWVNLAPTKGREQAGHRPALVISGNGFLGLVTELVTVVPITSTDRGWPNHIPTGSALNQPSWVMTEQIRTISRDRITSIGSTVAPTCLTAVRQWIADFLDLELQNPSDPSESLRG